MNSFTAKIFKIGINPYVLIPSPVLKNIFAEAGKDKGAIPVKGLIDDHPLIQTLVKYSGKWRLYLNTHIRNAAGKDVGDSVIIQIEFDPVDRTVPMHPKLKTALKKNKKANMVFQKLSPSLQKEIMRYIHHLKSEASVEKNVTKAILFLTGKGNFAGREKP